MTNFELDLHIPVIHPYIKFELNVCNRCRDNERKRKISDFFFIYKFKRANSVKNHQTTTNFELDLYIPVTYDYPYSITKF